MEVITRRQWGARTTIGPGRHVPPSQRRFFVVHYPVMANRDERQWCRDIEQIHANQRWNAAPGYNFIVGQSGTVYEGCGRDIRGIHSPPRNTDGWGVCYLQPTDRNGRPLAALTPQGLAGCRQLYDWLSSVAGRSLTMWWHGRDQPTACPGDDLRNWVRQGMRVPTMPPQQQTPEVTNLIASAVAQNGTLHVFRVGPQRRTVWFTIQRRNETAWGGQQPGRIAAWSRFLDAPSGRTITGIAASRSEAGVLNVWITLDNGMTCDRWQRPNETQWRGAPDGGWRIFIPA